MTASDNARNWKLYARALDILEGRANGHALPVIRKLANRGFAPAITVLSDYVSENEAVALLRKAARKGDALSAYNLAITHRNRGDMLRYRVALKSAARLDPDAATEVRRFKTRFPEKVMGNFGRLSRDVE
jgi:TPR repeat protein